MTTQAAPDFRQPGVEGDLPRGVPEWRDGLGELTAHGLIYTASDVQNVVPCGDRYRIFATFKRKVSKEQSAEPSAEASGSGAAGAGYADLYRRVARLVQFRASEMSCAHGEPLQSRTVGYCWTSIPASAHHFPMAAMVTELACSRSAFVPREPEPSASALLQPGGTPQEEFSRICSSPAGEVYNEYDVRDERSSSFEPFTFSYGERVESCSGLDYAPLVERAEHRAQRHYRFLEELSGSPLRPFAKLRRRWFSASQTFAVVVVYFQL